MIPSDKFRGPGSGTFTDLTYFVDDSITVGEILNAINQAGFKMVPFRYQGQIVADKVSIDEIDIGIEPVEEPVQTLSQDELQQGGPYGRY
jgi:hypothetical protein